MFRMYDPWFKGCMYHSALPSVTVRFLGEYKPCMWNVTLPVASGLTMAVIKMFSPIFKSVVFTLIIDCAFLTLRFTVLVDP